MCQKEFKSIKTVFNLEKSLPQLYANEKQLKQMIVNLVINAADAMPDGGVLILTTGFAESEAGNRIVFTLTDTGAGIAAGNQEKIFDPFFTTKQPGKGTGLGLSNVYRIVELAGGEISFSSVPEKGTIFVVKFPAIEE